MSALDYYARLGVSPTASNDELRHAWRSRAFDLHPDRNPGDDGTAFRAVVEAWEVLSSPEGRARLVHLHARVAQQQHVDVAADAVLVVHVLFAAAKHGERHRELGAVVAVDGGRDGAHHAAHDGGVL